VNLDKITKKLNRVLLYFCVILVIIVFVGPFYWVLITSLQSSDSLYQSTPNFLPRNITFNNFLTVLGLRKESYLRSFSIVQPLKNSIIVATFTTIICIALGIFAAYAFTRLKFKGSGGFFIAIIFTEMLPPVAILLPIFLIFKRLSLTNSLIGLIILYISWFLPIVTWVLYSYFMTIPKDLEDSARIDGATRIGAIFKVIIPLTLPGITSAGVICFIFCMGEFMGAITLLTRQDAQTVPLALAQYVTKSTVEWGMITASSILAVLIPVLLVLIFQRFIINGLTAGSVKE
jgi:multiple sugar transport system permease protein